MKCEKSHTLGLINKFSIVGQEASNVKQNCLNHSQLNDALCED